MKPTLKSSTLYGFLRILFGLTLIIGVVIMIAAANVGRSKAAANMIYYSNNDWQIMTANIDGSSPQVLYDGNPDAIQPTDLAIDKLHGKIYFIDGNMQNIRRINLNGSGPVEDITPISGDVGYRNGIALDVGTQKIYYTTGNPEWAVKWINMDGSGGGTLYNTDITPFDIALDLKHGKIFFIDDGFGKIVRMDLNGTNVQDLIPDQMDVWDVNGLVLDVEGGKIFFTTWNPDYAVRMANLDGSGSVTTLYSAAQSLDSPGMVTLDVSAGMLYYADINTGNVRRLETSGGTPEDVIAINNGAKSALFLTLDPPVPTAITLNGFSAQPSHAAGGMIPVVSLALSLVGLVVLSRRKK